MKIQFFDFSTLSVRKDKTVNVPPRASVFRNGVLSFNKKSCNTLNMQEGEYYKVGVAAKGNRIYLVATDDVENSIKVTKAHNTLTLPFGKICNKLGIDYKNSEKVVKFGVKQGVYEDAKMFTLSPVQEPNK